MKDLDNRSRNRLLIVLFVGVLMGALDIAITAPALSLIQGEFGVNERAVSWVFTIYALGNLVGTPFMAKLSDVFGRRSIYVLDVLLFAGGSLIVALSPAFGVLLVGRAIQGFGAGGIFPVASAVIGDTFPPEKRGGALGLIGAVFGLAFLIGPIIGGVVLLVATWHWLFLINIPIAAGLVIGALRLLPNTRPEHRRPFDWPGMAVILVLLTALSFGISQIDVNNVLGSLGTVQVWGPLLLAIVLMPVFWWLETRAEDPVLSPDLFRSRQMGLANVFAGGAGFAESGVSFVPVLLVAALGVTAYMSSIMLLPVVLIMAVGSPLAGQLLDRRGSRFVITIGTASLALGLIAVGIVPITTVTFYVAAVPVGIGLAFMLGAPLRYIMLSEASASQRAAAQGSLALFTRVGYLVGAALVGAIAASDNGSVQGWQQAFLVLGIVSLALFAATFALKRRPEELAAAQRNHPQAAGSQPAR
ncbi:MAG: MFS transporter [Caldilineales bacterium]